MARSGGGAARGRRVVEKVALLWRGNMASHRCVEVTGQGETINTVPEQPTQLQTAQSTSHHYARQSRCSDATPADENV